MFENINKISIIGGSGTGKTTLANSLSKVLNLPVYHIDGIHYMENWKARDKEERDKIILQKVKEKKWIIDGTYRSTLNKRLNESDLIIFLDYSTIARIKGVMKRYKENNGKEKEEIPGCKERMNWEFFKTVLEWKSKKRENVVKELKQIDKEKILIFKNRKELNKWYYNQFNQKIIL